MLSRNFGSGMRVRLHGSQEVVTTLSAQDYIAAFEHERQQEYPAIDAFERRIGYALDRERLEKAAAVLACPLKDGKHKPASWQHGRVIYALARQMIATLPDPIFFFLDIGSAKGFSALCLQWALDDAPMLGRVWSVDVIDPKARVQRNTIAECNGLKTLAETLEPWSEAQAITFAHTTGRLWLTAHPGRVHMAVVDGKHTYDEVSWEATLLVSRQQPGDVIFFDDLQIKGVRDAVSELRGYDIEELQVLPTRQYAIARKQ